MHTPRRSRYNPARRPGASPRCHARGLAAERDRVSPRPQPPEPSERRRSVSATAWPAMAKAALLEEVDRFVCDEKRTVTYQWLSEELDMTANHSKRCALTNAPPPPPARCSHAHTHRPARLRAGC